MHGIIAEKQSIFIMRAFKEMKHYIYENMQFVTKNEIRTLTDTPTLNGVDSNLATPLAKYSISIQVDYLDYTHRIWN